MARHLKQSAVSDTASAPSVFFWARLKLTGVYVLILAVILIGFSGFLYQSFGRNLSEADENDFAGPDIHQHFVQNTLANVEQEIILIDLIILLAAAGVSYMVAGYTLRPIQRSLEAQRAFSENASHELRTPLAVMKNDIEVLLRNPSPSKDLIHSTLHSNIEEIDRMSKMAEDLLLLARSQNHVLEAEKINIAGTAHKIADKMRPSAAKKQISLSVSDSTPLFVQGNAAACERVLMNLLRNAIDHTPAGGAITVTTSREKNHAVLKISDTGAGIKAKDLPRVFERFYKGESAKGTGLGLSIVKEIVTQHDGNIHIDSIEGNGTTITMQFPIA
jgi:signal transduction histidine kinase